MAIGSDYPHPIIVNGYQCRNCDDVADAKRNIDPSQSAFDVKATEDKSGAAFDARSFTLGGSLGAQISSVQPTTISPTIGGAIDRLA